MTPGVLVAANIDDGSGGDDDESPAAAVQPAAPKTGISVDEQLSKALELLKAKTA